MITYSYAFVVIVLTVIYALGVYVVRSLIYTNPILFGIIIIPILPIMVMASYYLIIKKKKV